MHELFRATVHYLRYILNNGTNRDLEVETVSYGNRFAGHEKRLHQHLNLEVSHLADGSALMSHQCLNVTALVLCVPTLVD